MLIIGAGFGGICMAAKAIREGLNTLVLERADEVGGTWRDNTYPGCACDTQSHHYSLSFATNADWSRRYASQPEILDYLKKTAGKLGVTPQIRFGERVTVLTFDEEKHFWTVKTEAGQTYQARNVVSAVGQLNQPKIPDIPGLKDFSGPVMHSAQWDHGYDFAGKSIAVIGSGASAIQLIPPLAEQASHMTVFQRSPHWIIGKNNLPFKPWQKFLFRYVPFLKSIYRAKIYWGWERSWPEFLKNSKQGAKQTAAITAELKRKIADPDLAKKLIPKDPLGCKRILLSDDYLPALQQDHVDLVTDGVERIEKDAIITTAGDRIPVDCIVMATGFKAHDFLPGITVTGRCACNLHQQWREAGGAEAYMGITAPFFPNLFFLYGPNTNLGHNSIVFMLECQSDYVMEALSQVKKKGATSIEVKKTAKERFYTTLNYELWKTVWDGGCTSWYKTDEGKIVNNWSTDTFTYWWRTRDIEEKDYLFD